MCAVTGESGKRTHTTWPPAPRPLNGTRLSHARMLGKKFPNQNWPPRGPAASSDCWMAFASENRAVLSCWPFSASECGLLMKNDGSEDSLHRQRQVAAVQQPRRDPALCVAELVGVVARHHEHAVLLPLERRLRPAGALPYGGKTAPLDNVDGLVDRHLQGGQRCPGWDLCHARLAHPLLS